MKTEEKINNFFKKLKLKDEYKYFLLKKFYIKPKSVFNKTKEDIDKNDYYDKDLLENYINFEFINLLNIILYDDDFLEKIDYYSLKSLNVFINDFKNKYMNDSSICDLFDEVIRSLNINIRIKYKKEIKVYDLKDEVFDTILNDRYDNYSAFLYFHRYDTDKVIDTLVCDNRFLDILENNILAKELDEYTISNIINILLSSIRIKTNNPESINESFTRDKLIKRNYYKLYDVERAKELVYRLKQKLNDIKQNRKIIYFP